MVNKKGFYEEIYGQESEIQENPYGWIQWKGTDVSIDLYCECGHLGHFYGEFFYHFECSACGKKYAVGQNVKLIPLNEEQIQHIGRDNFKTCDLEDV